LHGVRKLFFGDLIRRVAHPDDRRILHIELTDAGRHLHREMLPVQFQAENDICAPLSEHERETLVRLLGKLQASLLELSGRERHERPHHAQPLAAANDDAHFGRGVQIILMSVRPVPHSATAIAAGRQT